MEENEVNLIDLNENHRLNISSINRLPKNDPSFAVHRNNRLNSQPIRHESVQTDPPIDAFPATWLVELKSQADSLHQEMANAYNSFAEYPIANLNEIKALDEHERKYGQVSLVDEHRHPEPPDNEEGPTLPMLSVTVSKDPSFCGLNHLGWESPKIYQRPLNREGILNFQSREQNLRQNLVQMLKSANKLKGLISVGLDTENVDKTLLPTGVTMTPVTQTKPIYTYVKFLHSVHGTMPKDSASSEGDSSRDASGNSDDSSVTKTSVTQTRPIYTYVKFLHSLHATTSRDSNFSEEDSSRNPSDSSDDSSVAEISFTNVGLDSGMVQKNVDEQSLSEHEVDTGQRQDAKNAPSLVNEGSQAHKMMANKAERRGRNFRFRTAEESGKGQYFRNLTGARETRNKAIISSIDKDLDSTEDVFEDFEENFEHQYFDHLEDNQYRSDCLNDASTLTNRMHRTRDSGFRTSTKIWGEPFLNMDIDNEHQFIDISRISNINVHEDRTSDIEEPSLGINYDSRTLDGSKIKLRKKILKNDGLKTDKDETRQIKYTSKDQFYDLIVDTDESVESDIGQRYNSQKKPERSQRKLLGNHPIAHSTPLGTENSERQKSFSFRDYLSDLKRIHNRKPSTKRTKEFDKNESSDVEFDFEDYYQKLTNIHSKYKNLKDVITKAPSSQ